MNRLAMVGALPVMWLAALAAQGAAAWPAQYRFSGRWDLRVAGRAVTVSSGSYVRARFSGTALAASFDLASNSTTCTCTPKGAYPTIAWQVDGGEWREAEIAASVTLAEGLASGPHTVMLMVRGLDEHQSRWTPPLVASVTFTGFMLAGGGRLEAPLARWRKPALTMEFLGDSITEGVLVNEGRAGVVPGIPFAWSWLADARLSYAGQTAQALGAEWRQVGFGATGLLHGGSGGAPGALETFGSFYAGCPRDSWRPDVVVVNHGTNDGGMPAAEFQALYARYLEMIRKAYPKAKIAALRPFCGAQAGPIRAVVEARVADGDRRVYYVDSTGWYDGPIHPNADGSAGLATKLAAALKAGPLASR